MFPRLLIMIDLGLSSPTPSLPEGYDPGKPRAFILDAWLANTTEAVPVRAADLPAGQYPVADHDRSSRSVRPNTGRLALGGEADV